MAKLDQRHRIFNRQLTLKQPFYHKDKPASVGRTQDDDVYGGMFLTPEEVKKDIRFAVLYAGKFGTQNRTRGTKHKRLRLISKKARRRNRGRR